jgi:hypothetical protein
MVRHQAEGGTYRRPSVFHTLRLSGEARSGRLPGGTGLALSPLGKTQIPDTFLAKAIDLICRFFLGVLGR